VTAVPFPEQGEVLDPTAIAMLTDLRALRFLMPFMRSEHTLTTAAAALEKRPSTVAYWIPKFVACGLLVETGATARAGASMRRYRAPARRLTVPFNLIPVDRRVALLDEGRLRMLRRFLDGIDEQMKADRDVSLGFSPHGLAGTEVNVVETDEQRRARRYTDGWQMLRLDEADSHALANELEDVVAKYAERTGRNTYLVHIGVARNPRFRWRSVNDGLSE
jgi:hypothetical protein